MARADFVVQLHLDLDTYNDLDTASTFRGQWPWKVTRLKISKRLFKGFIRGVFPKFATGLKSMTKSKFLFHVMIIFTIIM